MEHHPSAVVTADPPVGQLYTTDEVATLLRVTSAPCKSGSATDVTVRYGRLLRVRQADLASFGEVLSRHSPLAPRTRAPAPPPAGAAQE